MRKTYSNTHVFYLRSKYEPGLFGAPLAKEDKKLSEIFYLIMANNIPQLRIFIENKGNINEQIVQPETKAFFKGETPLHIAIRSKASKEVIKLLMNAGANLDLVAEYPKKAQSIRNLLLSNPNYSALLKNIKTDNSNTLGKRKRNPK